MNSLPHCDKLVETCKMDITKTIVLVIHKSLMEIFEMAVLDVNSDDDDDDDISIKCKSKNTPKCNDDKVSTTKSKLRKVTSDDDSTCSSVSKACLIRDKLINNCGREIANAIDDILHKTLTEIFDMAVMDLICDSDDGSVESDDVFTKCNSKHVKQCDDQTLVKRRMTSDDDSKSSNCCCHTNSSKASTYEDCKLEQNSSNCEELKLLDTDSNSSCSLEPMKLKYSSPTLNKSKTNLTPSDVTDSITKPKNKYNEELLEDIRRYLKLVSDVLMTNTGMMSDINGKLKNILMD